MGHAFELSERDDGIGLVTFDLPDKKVNSLSGAVLTELAHLVAGLGKRTDLKGLLFRSGKPGQFIAGADLNEMGTLAFAPKERINQALMLGHDVFDRISELPFPTVALIDGPCMGGGTELALALDERLAAAGSMTQISFPEVKLGLIPAWGGTQRLPRLIGLHAIEMILSGNAISAERAAALGLVFDAVPPDRLIEEGCRRIEQLGHEGAFREQRRRRQRPWAPGEDALRFACAMAKAQVVARTKGQYPAPLIALEAIGGGATLSLDEGLSLERKQALKVVGTPTVTNLVSIFLMRRRLARDPGVSDRHIELRPIHRVGVLGAGQMGAGIATAHARSGIPAVMVDVDEDRLANGLKRAQQVVTSRIEIGRATPEDLAQMLSRLNTSTTRQVFADCDVVVEAITEDEQAKTSAFRELTDILRPGAILASNTSTISINQMAASVPDPTRFLGMHFFHPVDRMELVEVIRGDQTSDETVATIVALARRLRKTPIVVRDCPGFLVNRLLGPYMGEAVRMLREGATMAAIDEAAEHFGMPMGPIALHDLVGLDTIASAARVLVAADPGRSAPDPILEELVATGRLGQKTGAGFRRFTGRKGKAAADPAVAELLKRHHLDGRVPHESEIVDRLFLPMLLEATRILEEDVVRDPADIDLSLILGIGFPPFRGGLLRWCDAEGAGAILDRLTRYEALGRRFEPTEMLKRMARTDATFYPRPGAVHPGASASKEVSR